jgi:hypothetical protein
MRRAKRILQTVLFTIVTLAFLYSLPVRAQEHTAPVDDAIGSFNTSLPGFGGSYEAPRPPVPNPFAQPASAGGRPAKDGQASDSLPLLQLDRNWLTASAQTGFTAPPSFYSFSHNQATAADWNSALTGVLTAYLNRASTTYVRTTGDLETNGQRREAGATGEPGSQAFTMDWEVVHLVPTRLGSLEVAAGSFRQQLLSYAALPNSPLTDTFAGVSVFANGFESSLTLPDKNLSFSLRFGTQHLGPVLGNAPTKSFELSWTW